jgi:predicted nucleic acid-binding protein
MIVVSDTTPLRHLIAIGQVDLLSQLYGSVTVPAAVWQELQAESTPAAVRAWLARVPDWLDIRSPIKSQQVGLPVDHLDAGEREAIQLAIELDADLLLIDDRDGRALALRLQLPVIGTLGVLERADVVGVLKNLPDALADLEASGFYLSARLRETVLERHRIRHKTTL